MSTVTCHTDGCGNQDIPLEMTLGGIDDDGNPWQVGAVVCGACGQEITDVEPPLSEGTP